MVGYDLAFFSMELVPCRNQSSEASEIDPILCPSTSKDNSDGSEFTSEIKLVGDSDCDSLEADEISSLVATEQPQCRICLETGGPYLT